ncbi:SDR family oxidoreductase [Rubritalea marina]|uniref:SDR family oxidoreductase n=1 Tax=Rubritalea marina TaxID=361055 RepID=UPI00037614D1|nr:SDR family oxidoreductase [Rubritalea marina]
MRVLVTGANGYIGLRLIPSLLDAGHEVLAFVRNPRRFPTEDFEEWGDQLRVLEGDFLRPEGLPDPLGVGEVDVAYYLVHSMGDGAAFGDKEECCATSFVGWLNDLGCGLIVYLGGITPDEVGLSEHLASRNRVAEVLDSADASLTCLRASIIVGSGSASFEIIRDLVEKLPMMITPKWTRTRCQPIAIRNVVGYLLGVIEPERRAQVAGKGFDIGGPDVLTYQEMLTGYARVRGLKRVIVPVPLLSPKLSAHWLYFMTATSFALAKALVGSLHLETLCRENTMAVLVPQDLLNYDEAIELALSRVAQNRVASVWYDAISSGSFDPRHIRNVQVPAHGVLQDAREVPLKATREEVINAVWRLGGDSGWPSMDWAWRLRGLMDKMVGGSGMRRGRRDQFELRTGEALDFWRVVVADREQGRLVLFAEMKLPGEAWLEFTVKEGSLSQRAVFRPRGLFGRLYWASTYPFHLIIFPQMVQRLAEGE